MGKYLLTGLVNTGFTAAVMAAGGLAGWDYRWYSAAGYGAGMVLSFVLNLRFTFAVKDRRPPTVVLRGVGFFLIGLALLGLAEGTQTLLVETFGWPTFPAVALGMVLYTGLGFLLNRLVLFREKAP